MLFASHAGLEGMGFGIPHGNFAPRSKRGRPPGKGALRKLELLASECSLGERWRAWLRSVTSCTRLAITNWASLPYLRQRRFRLGRDLQFCPPPKILIASNHLARARTRVTSSGCSLAPIQSSTEAVTISLMRGNGNSRFSRNKSINRCSPNSPKSFSGSVTPSV
jgi:hypothetical protein